jgi:hypothetical protein
MRLFANKFKRYGKAEGRRFAMRGAHNIRVLHSVQSVPKTVRDATVTDVDRERFARARERGERAARSDHAVVAVHYDEQRDAIELCCGAVVSPEGDAISWRALDVDIDVTRFIAISAEPTPTPNPRV